MSEVDVGIDEARYHGPPGEVDNAGAGAFELVERAVDARQDLAVGDGQAACPWRGDVHRVDRPAAQQHVGAHREAIVVCDHSPARGEL